MYISWVIAKRYLFGKKSTNAINWITGISILGISIGTTALILILSVFNGFEGLMKNNLDRFNPDLKIVPQKGKFFTPDKQLIYQLSQVEGLSTISKSIEELTLLEYNDNQHVGILKGVDSLYTIVNDIDDAIIAGEFDIQDLRSPTRAVIGRGVYDILDISIINQISTLRVHVPSRRKKILLGKDFKSRSIGISGVFSIHNERDYQYVITSYDFAARLLDMYDQVSAIEIKIDDQAGISKVQDQIAAFLTEELIIQNRYDQDASFLRIMNIEKWTSYLILTFTLILIIFNVIGCLWMIVLDKRKDISVLQTMGANKVSIRSILYFLGLCIATLGFAIGLSVSMLFYFLQKTVGIILVPDGFAINSYPIEMKVTDILIVAFTVLILGLLAAIPAARRAARITPYVRAE